MSMIDRLAELSELFAGLAVAIVILAVVSWFIGMSGPAKRPNDRAKSQSVSRETSQQTNLNKSPIGPAPRPAPDTGPIVPMVSALYLAPVAGGPMERVAQVNAVAGRGLAGDRYFLETGHWSGTDDCQVTMIAQEDLDDIERGFDVRVQSGEHRRNIVVRNLPLEHLIGRRFHIGSATFGYECPRPPCAYIQLVSEPGMTKALGKRAGICVRCIKSGAIEEGNRIVISNITLLQALKYRANLIFKQWQSNNHGHG